MCPLIVPVMAVEVGGCQQFVSHMLHVCCTRAFHGSAAHFSLLFASAYLSDSSSKTTTCLHASSSQSTKTKRKKVTTTKKKKKNGGGSSSARTLTQDELSDHVNGRYTEGMPHNKLGRFLSSSSSDAASGCEKQQEYLKQLNSRPALVLNADYQVRT